MSLYQAQIIRSLAEALAWFEKELAWGVEPAELHHLTDRIGELYAAMITRGQMALAVNQNGYDVVSRQGEHISVKTITSSNHVSFRKSTLHLVQLIMILRINVEEGEASIEEIIDQPATLFTSACKELASEYRFSVRRSPVTAQPLDHRLVAAEASVGTFRVRQYENGTIAVDANGVSQQFAMPILREIAADQASIL